jgi:hypothetical protein
MYIIQQVTVKQVLTETTKENLLASYEGKKRQLERETKQLQFEQKKAEKLYKNRRADAAGYYLKEMQERQEKMKIIEFEINQLQLLPLGSELKERELQTLREVKVGDCWEEIHNGKVIIVKDGKVIEIR